MKRTKAVQTMLTPTEYKKLLGTVMLQEVLGLIVQNMDEHTFWHEKF